MRDDLPQPMNYSLLLLTGSVLAGVGGFLYTVNGLLAFFPVRIISFPSSQSIGMALPSILVGVIGLTAAVWVFRDIRLGLIGELLAGIFGLVFDAAGFLVNPNLPGFPGLLLLGGATITTVVMIVVRRHYGRVEMRRLAIAALLPTGAALLPLCPVVFAPQTNNQGLGIAALVAPVIVAFIVNFWLPATNDKARPLIGALPLTFVFPIAVMLSVALEVARGQPANSSEVAMTWGIGLLVSPLIGLAVAGLAAIFGLLGACLKRKA